ncbi:MAG: hypothetical protein JOZ69_12455 [Myxococcales bacterium]|nr:hypothetical protein [Myxococcales bacterium]
MELRPRARVHEDAERREATVKAQAQALHDSGLAGHGFIYVNIDDFYYLNPNTDVDANGHWVVDTTKFPNGMASLASSSTASA